MSGGGGGDREGRGFGVSVDKRAVARGGLRAAPGPAGPRGGPNGEPRVAGANRVETPRAPKPQSQGPISAGDTGGAGTDPGMDPAQMIRNTAARLRRSRLARGGGLSNVRFGEATLG